MRGLLGTPKKQNIVCRESVTSEREKEREKFINFIEALLYEHKYLNRLICNEA